MSTAADGAAMARKPPPRKPPRARNASHQPDAVPRSRRRDQPVAAKKPGGKRQGPPRSAPARTTPSAATGAAPERGGGPGRPAVRKAAPAGTNPARSKGIWLYGRHPVEAALTNPRRSCHRLIGTAEALQKLPGAVRRSGLEVLEVERDDLDRRLGEGALHQGLALAVAPLPRLDLARTCRPEPGGKNLVLLLDQVQDPHNLGAILRSAAAFGVRAVIVPDRGGAPLAGVAAKAASGALDLVPVVEVTNLARSLEALKELGYWRLALDAEAETTIDAAPDVSNLALVLGAEGTGVRRLVAERCDLRVRLPIAPAMESLNVSVACGIALYALSERRGRS
jgi:23S rRNA (guanosine2251-2'-O)-methyltransferase